MDRPLKIAIAGAGMVTQHHLIGWSQAPNVQLVAICNRSVDKARERAAQFGIPKVYGDLAEMLDAEKPDALDVAVASALHTEYVLAAADRGIHVFCQKPLCPTLAEARDLVAKVGDRVRFMVHENWRFRPQYRQAAAWIAAGRTGAIRRFHMDTFSSGLIPAAPGERPFALVRQPFMATMPRFIVLELMIHHLDTTRFLVGGRMKVVAARARRTSPLVVGEDTAEVLLESDNGAIGTVSGTMCFPGVPPKTQDRLVLNGDRASIVFEGDRLSLRGDGADETVTIDLDAAYQASYSNAIAHFARAMHDGTPFETDPADNLETLRLVDDVYATNMMVSR